jgi:hypothetical protein
MEMIVQQMGRRFTAIQMRLGNYVNSRPNGRNLRDTMNDTRGFFTATGRLIEQHATVFNVDQKLRLVRLLLLVLNWFYERNNASDLPGTHDSQPSYASRTSFTLFASFNSALGQPGVFAETLARIDPPLLQGQDVGTLAAFERFFALCQTEAPNEHWVHVLSVAIASASNISSPLR